MKNNALAILIAFFLLALPAHTQINLLHEFAGGTGDGAYPQGSLIISGSTLFGMTQDSGFSNMGTIFKIENDGTGFALLHSFTGGVSDGANPQGSLIISGSTLFGMTMWGGDSNMGTIFKIETNGTGFTLIHEFAGGIDDGAYPPEDLVLSGSTLFGMTLNGGTNNLGTIFKIGTNGGDFTLLHEFTGSPNDGASPEGSLIISGSTIYGMTANGGANNSSISGTIFKIENDGNGFTVLHEFIGGADDGSDPWGSLILSGSNLYGMTRFGGDSDNGVIFKMLTNGTDYTLLHEFSNWPDDGEMPEGSLILSGSCLFGMTQVLEAMIFIMEQYSCSRLMAALIRRCTISPATLKMDQLHMVP